MQRDYRKEVQQAMDFFKMSFLGSPKNSGRLFPGREGFVEDTSPTFARGYLFAGFRDIQRWEPTYGGLSKPIMYIECQSSNRHLEGVGLIVPFSLVEVGLTREELSNGVQLLDDLNEWIEKNTNGAYSSYSTHFGEGEEYVLPIEQQLTS